MLALFLTWLLSMPGSVPAAEIYHTNRVFTAVEFNLQGTPTVWQLGVESARLTNIVRGAAIALDLNNTYAIENPASYAMGYGTAEEAWNEVLANSVTASRHPGKIYDNVGWVRGAKLVMGEWGAYFWSLQNQIAFRSSASNLWQSPSNGAPTEIANVFVGSLGIYSPLANVVDVGPNLAGARSFPGADQGESREYRPDITNVFYRLVIPEMFVTPRVAVRCAGGANVQYRLAGTNIPNGVTWTIIPSDLPGGAALQLTDPSSAEVAPGAVAANYKIRATANNNTNFHDEVSLTVLEVALAQTNFYALAGNTAALRLTPESSSNVQWQIVPELPGGAYIEGSAAGTSVVINVGSIITNYTVIASAIELTNCYALGALQTVKLELTNIRFNWDQNSSASDAINIRQDYNTAFNIANGEWVKGGANIPVCYPADKAVTIKAAFTVQPAGIGSAEVWALSKDFGGSLGDVLKTNVVFVAGIANDVLFRVDGQMPNAVRKTTNDIWQWQVENINGSGSAANELNASGAHTVYTILAEPVAPWENTWGSPKNAWTRVLDYSSVWAAGAADATGVVARITTGAYSGFGKSYYGYQSRTTNNLCHLSVMLSTNVLDCRDMSAVVELFSRILGEATVQVRRVNGPFYSKPILPIGHAAWTNSDLNFHQFGWQANGVNDASFKLNDLAPYVPVHDDLDGNYKTNLYESGDWVPLAPSSITDFD